MNFLLRLIFIWFFASEATDLVLNFLSFEKSQPIAYNLANFAIFVVIAIGVEKTLFRVFGNKTTVHVTFDPKYKEETEKLIKKIEELERKE